MAILCVSSNHCNIVRDFAYLGYYAGLTEYLELKYPNEPEVVDCILNEFKNNHLEYETLNWKALQNPKKVSDKIVSHVEVYEVYCRVEDFILSPIGIICVILILLASIVCFCCLC